MLRNLGGVRLAVIGGVTVGVLVFVIYFAARMSSTNMDLLYGDLAPQDASAIIAQLEASNVPFKVEGNAIYVPQDQRDRLRMQMAELALPGGSAAEGYKLFDNQSALGATDFTQKVNLVRATEGELARSIRTIQGIENARVHLVMPRREPFTRQQVEPTASVIILMRTGRLQPAQVIGIQNLVAAAVPQLKPQSVSIIDQNGTLLTRSMEDTGIARAETQNELRKAEEARIARSIESLLEQTVGQGKVRAEVFVEMDFNRVQTNRRTFDPDGSVLRSSTTISSTANTNETVDSVSVQQNLPQGQFNQGGAPAVRSQENHSEATENFEISEENINELKESGTIKRLSVAVMVDGIMTPGTGGAPAQWAPRSEDEMNQLKALVRSTVGFDQGRGDLLEVHTMRFVEPADLFDETKEWSFAGFDKSEVMKLAEGLGVALVAILVILLVVRPLIQRAFEGLLQTGSSGILTADMQATPQLTGPGGPIPLAALGAPDDFEDAEELIDIDKVEGRVKASSIRKIGEIVDKHPEEALSIIRNWLYEEA